VFQFLAGGCAFAGGADVWPDQGLQMVGSILLRGLEKVNGEWALMAITHNLL
jgi:hypothetical protein